MQIHWHRRDLRAVDNHGLSVAAAEGPVVPAFVFDDDVLAHAGAPRVRYVLDSLSDLRSWYRDRGSDLVVARGDPADVLPALAEEYDADRVVWNEGYSGLATERDRGVEAALSTAGVGTEQVTDAVCHRPGDITTTDGDPYAVYTYYWKKWRDREKPDPYDAPAADDLAAFAGDALPTLADLGFEPPSATLPEAGRAGALARLEAFRDGDVYDYEADRDYPAREGTSRISQDLTFGTLGPREVHEAALAARERAGDDDARESVEAWRGQLAWREFYVQVLDANPEVVTENYRSYENDVEWWNDPEEIAAWKAGETGYPFVDAGMRQLRAEAFVHNRVRMVVASFLTKDLLVDWRVDYDHFRDHLVDHDTASDTGGWQWAASTGTDAQPYFRVFNPTTQGERYDPDATYIRDHVPELADVDAEVVHDWPSLSPAERDALAPEYPEPIVDHGERRELALATFERARGEE